MSHVTNAILCWGILEEEDANDNCPRLAEVNATIEAMGRNGRGFVDINVSGSWYGGTKSLQANMAMAAFNHFGPDEIWKAVESARWEYPDEVCLMYQDENDDVWSMRSFGGTVTPPSIRMIAPGMPALNA